MQGRLANPHVLWEEDLKAFDPLEVGIHPNFPIAFDSVINILKMQVRFLDNPALQWGKLSEIFPSEHVNTESLEPVVSLLESAWTQLDVSYEAEDVPGAIEKIVRNLSDLIKHASSWPRVRDCNAIVWHFIRFLDQAIAEELQKTGKSKIDIFKTLRISLAIDFE